MVRIDGQYYHCDPTWDSGTTAGLHYFGMTDEERLLSGVENFSMCYDMAYGEIVCDSDTFADFRGVTAFSLTDTADHRIMLEYGGETKLYDTEQKMIVG